MPVCQYASARPFRELSGFLGVLALIMLFAAAKPVLHDTLDPDFFRHLRTADHISNSSLGELGMKWVLDHGGLRGAMATQATLEAAFVILLLLCAIQGL